MSLADALAGPVVIRHGPRCSVAVLLDKLDAATADILREKLAQPIEAVPHAWLAEQLRANDYDLQAITIARHRRGLCKCR